MRHAEMNLLPGFYLDVADIRQCVVPEKKKAPISQGFSLYGGARRDRTDDLYAASVALSQLSYGPEAARIQPCYPQPVNTQNISTSKGFQ